MGRVSLLRLALLRLQLIHLALLQKNEAQHSLRPVTIGQLKNATQAHTDAEWMIENDEIGQVRDPMCEY
jgi:hypothetical protein